MLLPVLLMLLPGEFCFQRLQVMVSRFFIGGLGKSLQLTLKILQPHLQATNSSNTLVALFKDMLHKLSLCWRQDHLRI